MIYKYRFQPSNEKQDTVYSEYVTHLIEMSRMSANYIFGKTAKCDQKSSFAHFHILLEMSTERCL